MLSIWDRDELIKKSRLISWNNAIKGLYLCDVKCKDIRSLNNKVVVYEIYIPSTGKIYIGCTEDFGQRINDHCKCGRKFDKKLYQDIRLYDAYISVLFVSDDVKHKKKLETEYIEKSRSHILEKIFTIDDYCTATDEHKRNLYLTYMYNYTK